MEPVGHAQSVFTIPKMLRAYLLHHPLLGALSLAAYETVKELMAAAAEEKGFRPGMVSVVQTFGEGAQFHIHVHALCSRGGWAASGERTRCRMWMRERPRSSARSGPIC